MRIPFLRRMNKNTELKFEKSSEKWKKKKKSRRVSIKVYQCFLIIKFSNKKQKIFYFSQNYRINVVKYLLFSFNNDTT